MSTKALFVVLFMVSIFTFTKSQSLGFIEKQLLCALDRSPCDRMGNQIKAILPEIIGNKCRNCNLAQITYANNIAGFIQQRYPQAWGALLEKYSRNN